MTVDTSSNGPHHPTPPRAWAVLTGGFIALFFSAGVWHSFGVFFEPLLAEFGLDRTALSLVTSIAIAVIAATQLTVGRFMVRFGTSGVICTGLALMGIGLFLSGFATNITVVYLSFSLVMAAGYGFSSLTAVGNEIAQWFDRRRGMAIGIAFSGLSAGGLMLTPFIQLLILRFTWRMAFWILGAGLALGTVPLLWFLLRDRPDPDLRQEPHGPGEGTSETPDTSANIPVMEALRTPPFWLLSGAYFACGFTDFLLFFHFPIFATGLGIPAQTAANLLGLASGISIVGTVVLASLSDRTGRPIPLSAIYAVRAVGFLLLMVSRSIVPLYAFTVFYGFVLFASNPITSALAREIYGPKSFGTLFGYLIFAHYVGSFFGTLTGGIVYDNLGRYDEAFLIGAILLAGASACALILRRRMPATLR